MRPTKRRKPRRDTRRQLRKAALRLWDEHSTPATIAELLGVRESWIRIALEPVAESVVEVYGPGTTAIAIAHEKAVPVVFVKYVMRRINALSHGRSRSDRLF